MVVLPSSSLPPCRNVAAPDRSYKANRILHILFSLCCCANFRAELHRDVVRMGMHVVFPTILWPLSDLVMHYVQTFNSVGQNPCTVTAYMMGSCNGGREFFNCLHVLALRSYLICRIRAISTATGIQVLWP